jgi:tRNA pseudouridine38-40 synthase
LGITSSEPAASANPTGFPEDGGLVRVRLDLAYDGTDFSGWATQPGRRTVQEMVEAGVARVLRLAPPVRLVVAGRTDAGVHATGQVAHADLPVEAIDPERLRRGLNGVLPADIRLRAASAAPAGFDARFSALARRYRYRLTDDVPDPLRRRDTVAWARPLDVAAMHAAAAALLGEHDFAAYCKRREGATTIRRLLRLDCQRVASAIEVTVEADAFCHSMVRALVGALLAVGEGRKPSGWPADVLAAAVRDSSVAVAPAHGLTLCEVFYPADDALAARADVTRRLRVMTPP